MSWKKYPYLEAKYLRWKQEWKIYEEWNFVTKWSCLILVDWENSWELFDLNEDWYLWSTFKVFNVYQSIYPEYLQNFLLLKKSTFRNNKTWAAIPHLNKDLFFNSILPLPPLEEQKRIVAKLDELMPLLDDARPLEEEITNLEKEFPGKLRQSILQYAIQWKLVEQNPNDEPVSELFKKIKDTKNRLIGEWKIKKEKTFASITEEEKPFDIPSNREWIRFWDLWSFKKWPFWSSLTKSMFVPKWNWAIKVYEQKNAIQKDCTLWDYYITKEYFETNMTWFEVQPWDIIVSCAWTIWETYVLPEWIEKWIINQALMKMKIFEPLNIEYFLIYFDSVLKSSAKNKSNGAAIKNIPPFDILKNFLVPIPPLVEQKWIVAKLDELMKLCDELEEQINNLS